METASSFLSFSPSQRMRGKTGATHKPIHSLISRPSRSNKVKVKFTASREVLPVSVCEEATAYIKKKRVSLQEKTQKQLKLDFLFP